MAGLDKYKVSTAPSALSETAIKHNSLVDLVSALEGQGSVKVTVSEGKILIYVAPGNPGPAGAAGASPPATTAILSGNGGGGFSTVTVGAGLSFSGGTLRTTTGTSGAILRDDGSNGFASVTVSGGLRYTGGTLDLRDAGTGLMWGSGGDFVIATLGGGLTSVGTTVRTTAGTDYALLTNDGSHGFRSATIGSGLSYDGASGTLTANAQNTGSTLAVLSGNGSGGFANVVMGGSMTFDTTTKVLDTIQNIANTASPAWANIFATNAITGNYLVANNNVRSDNVIANLLQANTLLSVGTGSNMMNVAFANISQPMAIRELRYANLANANIEQFVICNNGSPENRWWPTWNASPASPIPKILTISSADY